MAFNPYYLSFFNDYRRIKPSAELEWKDVSVYIRSAATPAVPSASQNYVPRILELPVLTEKRLDEEYGITGFEEVSLKLDNTDGYFEEILTGMYVTIWNDISGFQYVGRITHQTYGRTIDIKCKDVHEQAFATELPSLTVNDVLEREEKIDGDFVFVTEGNTDVQVDIFPFRETTYRSFFIQKFTGQQYTVDGQSFYVFRKGNANKLFIQEYSLTSLTQTSAYDSWEGLTTITNPLVGAVTTANYIILIAGLYGNYDAYYFHRGTLTFYKKKNAVFTSDPLEDVTHTGRHFAKTNYDDLLVTYIPSGANQYIKFNPDTGTRDLAGTFSSVYHRIASESILVAYIPSKITPNTGRYVFLDTITNPRKGIFYGTDGVKSAATDDVVFPVSQNTSAWHNPDRFFFTARDTDSTGKDPQYIADNLGVYLPIIFGRAVKVPLIEIKRDDVNREYHYLIGHGIGRGGKNFSDVYNIYRETVSLKTHTGTIKVNQTSNRAEDLTTSPPTYARGFAGLEDAEARPDNWYKYWFLEITAGTGKGQKRITHNYDGLRNRVEVDTWDTIPDGTSKYELKEWRFYNGGFEPYVNIAYIRFKKYISDGNQMYADVNGLVDEVNPARAIESILTNKYWGLGIDVSNLDIISFNDVAINHLLSKLKCEGILQERIPAIDVLREILSFQNMYITRTPVQISSTTTPKFILHADQRVDRSGGYKTLLSLGNSDTPDNIISLPHITYPDLDDIPNKYIVKYRYNSATREFMQQITHNPLLHIHGFDEHVRETPFIYDNETADRYALYHHQKTTYNAYVLQLDIETNIETHRGYVHPVAIPELENHFLSPTIVSYPFYTVGSSWVPNTKQGLWQVSSVTFHGEYKRVRLIPYNDSVLTYISNYPLAVDRFFGIEPTENETPPEPVTDLAVQFEGVVTDGTSITVNARITWTPPESNYIGARVSYKKSDEEFYLPVAFGDTPVQAGFIVRGLSPNVLYDFQVNSVGLNRKLASYPTILAGTKLAQPSLPPAPTVDSTVETPVKVDEAVEIPTVVHSYPVTLRNTGLGVEKTFMIGQCYVSASDIRLYLFQIDPVNNKLIRLGWPESYIPSPSQGGSWWQDTAFLGVTSEGQLVIVHSIGFYKSNVAIAPSISKGEIWKLVTDPPYTTGTGWNIDSMIVEPMTNRVYGVRRLDIYWVNDKGRFQNYSSVQGSSSSLKMFVFNNTVYAFTNVGNKLGRLNIKNGNFVITWTAVNDYGLPSNQSYPNIYSSTGMKVHSIITQGNTVYVLLEWLENLTSGLTAKRLSIMKVGTGKNWRRFNGKLEGYPDATLVRPLPIGNNPIGEPHLFLYSGKWYLTVQDRNTAGVTTPIKIYEVAYESGAWINKGNVIDIPGNVGIIEDQLGNDVTNDPGMDKIIALDIKTFPSATFTTGS